MHPGIVFAVATLDCSMGCIPVTISVMPQSFESATEPGGGSAFLRLERKACIGLAVMFIESNRQRTGCLDDVLLG